VKRARDYYSPDSGQWEEEFAIAPRYTPLWLQTELQADSEEPLMGVQIQLPPFEELRDPMRGEGLPSTSLFPSDQAEAEQEHWRAMLVGPATRKGYRLTGDVPYRERAWPVILKATTILHEGSPVGWYDLDNGFVRYATLWDLAHLKQGVPQDDASFSSTIEAERERLEVFLGRPLWLLSEKQWDSAEFPPPIKYGPPFVKGVTAAAEAGKVQGMRRRDRKARDYPDMETALRGAQSKHDATHATRGPNGATVFSPTSRGYVKRTGYQEKGYFHWPERGITVDVLPSNAEMIHRLIDTGWDPEAAPEQKPESMRRAAEEVRDNPVDVADALPWVKVSRDPERYQEALKEAKAIGPIENAQSIYELLGPALLKEDQETFVVVLLDVRQQCRGVAEVHRGGRSRVSVSLIDVLRVVVASGAEGFVVVHNHPSGKASPSPADKDLTRSIERAAKLFDGDFTFVDHVICGNGEFYSFVEKKLTKTATWLKRRRRPKAA
jgi:hypothetical protein